MKHFIGKYICVAIFSLPLISNAAILCGAGTIRNLTEGYLGMAQTRILLDATEGSNMMRLNYGIPSPYKFDGLSRTLRAAFLSGKPVRIFANARNGCNYIDEIHICNVATDCK